MFSYLLKDGSWFLSFSHFPIGIIILEQYVTKMFEWKVCRPSLLPAPSEPAPLAGGPWRRCRGIWRSVGETTKTDPRGTSCWPGPGHQPHAWTLAKPLPTEKRIFFMMKFPVMSLFLGKEYSWYLPVWRPCCRPVWNHCPIRFLQHGKTPLRSSTA